jgi:hypothetical protein
MKTNSTNPPQYSIDPELIEKLAAIEHERWADWMQYMFDCGVKSGDDNIGVRVVGWPTKQFEHWQRQIETDYEDLSAKEKQSDRDQVDRYLPLLNQLIYTQVLELIGKSQINVPFTATKEARNQLRTELRAKAKSKFINDSQAVS